MERTLHYSVRGEYKPTDKEEQALIDLAKAYNWKYDWTCEDVQLTTLDYSLNWSYWYHALSEKEIWKIFHDRYSHLINKGLNDAEVIRSLNKAGVINLYHEDRLHGSTKVRGNEINAHQVIQFMLDVSKLMPGRIFGLHDEGDALYCPLLLKNGMTRPNYKTIEDLVKYWKDMAYLHDEGVWNVSGKEEYYKALLQLNSGWGDPVQYIRPLNKDSVFVKRGKAQTMFDFLIAEAKESEQYYEDAKSFPQLKVKGNHENC